MTGLGEQVNSRFAGKRVHVIGLGKWGTGRAVARVMWRRGAAVTVSDVKTAAELADQIDALQDTGVVVQTGEEAYRGIEEADLVVPSPGVPLDIPPLLRARAAGATVVSEIEIAFWIAPCPIIAVTGTKGKTTTAALIGELLAGEGKRALVGGNIGRPLVELAEAAAPDDILVGEVSSFQLEGIERFRPAVAVLLNLSADHLDRHATMDAYRAAKARIFANQRPEDAAVVNRDDPQAWAMRDLVRARLVPYTTEGGEPSGADVMAGWLRVEGERIAPASALRLPGRHNISNALAALAASRAAGATLANAAHTLADFRGVEHRLEIVGVIGGVTFVNDSQATTPAATIAALRAFGGRVALIAGGRPKVHDFTALADEVARRGAALILIGEAADEIAAAAQAAGVAAVRAGGLEEAVRLAYERARPGGTVLLSPACASFDMFADMADRGRQFKQLVRQLGGREGAPA